MTTTTRRHERTRRPKHPLARLADKGSGNLLLKPGPEHVALAQARATGAKRRRIDTALAAFRASRQRTLAAPAQPTKPKERFRDKLRRLPRRLSRRAG
jgi:hypothetical protein